MVFKIIIIVLLLIIFYCLGSALVFLFRSRRPEKMAKALTWRIILSFFVFVLLIIAYALGWVQPNNIMPAAPIKRPIEEHHLAKQIECCQNEGSTAENSTSNQKNNSKPNK